MDVKNLVMAVVGMVLAAVMIGGALLPSVASALVVSGDPITYYNNSGQAYKLAVPGDVLEGSRSSVDGANVDTWKLNNEPIIGFVDSTSWTSLIFSDGMYGQIFNSNNNSLAVIYDIVDNDQSPRYVSYVKLTFMEDTIEVNATLGGVENTYSWAYSWAYIPCESNDGVLIANAGPNNAYVSKDTFVVLAGFYSTGNIDRFYYSNNKPDLSIIGAGSGSYTKTYNLVEGTTDVYNLGVSVSITDGGNVEEFAPYQILVPYKIAGHADSGAAYSLFGALPIIVIAGLVMAGVYVFISRK